MDEGLHDIDKTPLDEQLHVAGGSPLARYRQKAVGEAGWRGLLAYEFFAMALADLGGAAGYVGRKLAARYLFRRVGGGLILGRGIVLRHPKKIALGASVAIDDYVLLDAAGGGDAGLVIGDRVIISRNCVIQAKTGPLELAERVDIGAHCLLSSVAGIHIGASTLIAGNCYIGGARYHHRDLQLPVMDQGGYSRGPLRIGEGSWLGAGAVVLDGVTLGRGVIVGAGAVVAGDVPDYAIAAGVPARVLRFRNPCEQHQSV